MTGDFPRITGALRETNLQRNEIREFLSYLNVCARSYPSGVGSGIESFFFLFAFIPLDDIP